MSASEPGQEAGASPLTAAEPVEPSRTFEDIHLVVSPEDAGLRLDRFLAAKGTGLSRSRIQRLIEAGHVDVAGRDRAAPGIKVRAGDTVHVRVSPPEPTSIVPTPIPLSLLYEDSSIIVVAKQAGMVVHPGAGKEEGTLVHALLHHCRDLSGIGGILRPGIVHRLDKDTSGVMVAAKTDQAHRRLAEQFSAGLVGKTYLALVKGSLRDKSGRIQLAIGRHPVERKKMSTRSRHARAAVTDWKILEAFGDATLLEVRIHTGRTHQIRVHMKAMGHPVVGDSVYGGPVRLRTGGRELDVPRQMLHSFRLDLRHPISGEAMGWEAPVPQDMAAVLTALRARTPEAGVPAGQPNRTGMTSR